MKLLHFHLQIRNFQVLSPYVSHHAHGTPEKYTKEYKLKQKNKIEDYDLLFDSKRKKLKWINLRNKEKLKPALVNFKELWTSHMNQSLLFVKG